MHLLQVISQFTRVTTHYALSTGEWRHLVITR